MYIPHTSLNSHFIPNFKPFYLFLHNVGNMHGSQSDNSNFASELKETHHATFMHIATKEVLGQLKTQRAC